MEKNFGNMDDRALDRLFKEAAEQYTPPVAPVDAWDNFVETKLSLQKKQKKKWFDNLHILFPVFIIPRLPWQLLISGMLVITGLWFGLRRIYPSANSRTGQTIVKNDSPDFRSRVAFPNPGHAQTATEERHAKGKKNTRQIRDMAVAKGQDGLLQPLSLHQALGGAVPLTGNTFSASATDPGTYFVRRPGGFMYPDALSFPAYPDKSGDVHRRNPDHEGYQALFRKGMPGKQDEPVPKKERFTPSANDDFGDNALAALNYHEEAATHAPRIGKEADGNGRWQVAMVGGSNLSIVKGTVSKTAGLNGGVMVQRRVKESRLSVETGVVVESMDYKVANNDFPPAGKDVSDAVSNINGTCTMVDVPVNIRYDLVHSKKNNAFVSTGVSAMWMTNQHYNYQYAGDNGVTQVNKDVSGQGKDLYAATNLSVGYEHHFKKTAVQLAPYVKIPIGTVGYGNLSLGSVGAQILIKQGF